MQKSNAKHATQASKATSSVDWQASASQAILMARAAIIRKIRHFFDDRGLLEVETPQLCHAIGTDPYLHFFTADYSLPGHNKAETCYLQTSPEFAMKRLLASGSGSIYQICKAYRNGEIGPLHNPEFSILEWYQINYDHHDLMTEVDALIQHILGTPPAEKITYRDLFENHFGWNPHQVSLEKLKQTAIENHLAISAWHDDDRDNYLQYLLSSCIEPSLGIDRPLFLYDYPASQAALANITTKEGDAVGERFELYVSGIELANGFHELSDATEQSKRFKEDLLKRKQLNLATPELDNYFLAALPHLPPCAGVAIGLDRLIMLALQQRDIQSVLAFPFSRI